MINAIAPSTSAITESALVPYALNLVVISRTVDCRQWLRRSGGRIPGCRRRVNLGAEGGRRTEFAMLDFRSYIFAVISSGKPPTRAASTEWVPDFCGLFPGIDCLVADQKAGGNGTVLDARVARRCPIRS